MAARGESGGPRDALGLGSIDTVISVEDVERQAAELASDAPSRDALRALSTGDPFMQIEGLVAGYGKMEVLHSFDLYAGRGQSLCLVGPNGAGKSTVLHSVYGFTDITGGAISVDGRDVTRLSPNEKLKTAGVAYILQDNSVFPDMTVLENC